MTRTTTEAPVVPRNRWPLYGVLTAFGVSLTGTRIAAIALPWFVLVTTGSPAKAGLLALCEMAPYVLAKALGGPWIDKIGARRVSIVAGVVSGAVMAVIPVLWWLGSFNLVVLFGLAMVLGAARGPGDSAKEVFVPYLAEQAHLSLERVTGIGGSIERLASTLGPAIGGGLVALVGPIPAIAATAGGALLSAVLISVSTRGHTAEPDSDADEPYLARLRAGYRFLRGERLLWSIIVMVGVTNFLDAAMMSVLVPVWAKESGAGPAGIGLIGSCFGLAALAGSVCATLVAERLPRRASYLAGFLLAGAPRFIVLAMDAPLHVIAAVWVVSGIGCGFINPIISAIFFERTPRSLLGRAGALGDALAWSLIPVGGVAAAGAIAMVGLGPALVTAGLGYLVATTVPGLRPEWSQMRRRTPGAVPAPDTVHPG